MSEDKKGTPEPTVDQSGPQPIPKQPQAFGSRPGEPMPKTMPKPPAAAQQPAQAPSAPPEAPRQGQPAAETTGGSQDPIQTVSFKTEMPSATFLLPSRGLLYPNPIPDGKIGLRSMGLREQMILNTPALHVRDEAFPMIFRQCVTGLQSGMDVLDLFAEDKNAILVALRQLSYGPKYKVTVTCPARGCRKEYEYEVDLEQELSVRYLDADTMPDYPLVIPAEHLHCKKRIRVRLQTWKDEINLIRERDRAMDEQNKLIDPTLQIRLGQQIVDIDGLDKNHMMPFLEALSAHDVSIIEQFIAKELFGIDTTISPPECPKCGHRFKADLTINEGFFRATLPEA